MTQHLPLTEKSSTACGCGHEHEDNTPEHDPKPLLAQIAERENGGISVRYLDEGPDAWRLLLTRA
jgi:uncharacterized protein (DUF2249 family)